MAITCGQLTDSVTYNCTNPPQSGCDETLYIINLDDVDTWPETNGVLGTLTLKAGKNVYKIEGVNKSLNAQHTISRSGFTPGYIHTVLATLPNNAQPSKEQLEALAKGRAVAVIDRLDQSLEVYGRRQGMFITEQNGDVQNGETDGNISFTLQTPDGEKEKKIPQLWEDVSYSATKAALVALVP